MEGVPKASTSSSQPPSQSDPYEAPDVYDGPGRYLSDLPSPHRHADDGGDQGRLNGNGTVTRAEESEVHEEGKKGKKRRRQVLSCTLCVRRKIRCDKKIPCTACVRRGDPSGCVVEGVEDPDKQPFALNDEHLALRNRVANLEVLVSSLAGIIHNVAASHPNSVRPPAGSGPPVHQPSRSEEPASASGRRPETGAIEASDTAVEFSAASVLQRLRQGTSEARVGKSGLDASSVSSTDAVPSTISVAEEASIGGGDYVSSAFVGGQGSSSLHALPKALPRTSTAFGQDLRFLNALLPTRTVSDTIVASFMDRVDWHIHVLHTPMFRDEYTSFWISLTAGSVDVAPSWLATYLMVLAIGLHYTPSSASPVSSEDHKVLPTLWREAAEKALGVADWSGKPQVRCVQAILLMTFYWHHIGETDRLVIWIGAGVRIAQALGMHMLDKQAVVFPNDVFRPQGESGTFFFRQELGKRLWWYLCIFDWDISYTCRRISVLYPQEFSTPPPLNLSDDEIVSGHAEPPPLTRPTVSTNEIILAEIVFLTHQWLRPIRQVHEESAKATITLETVASLNSLILEKANLLPDFFSLDKASDPDTRAIDAREPYIPLQRLYMGFALQSRLLRLNRRFIFDNTPETAPVRTVARAAASRVLSLAQEFRRRSDCWDKFWWIFTQSLLACATLLISNTHLASLLTPPPQDIDKHRLECMALLTALRTIPSPPPYIEQGIRIIELLLAEELIASRNFIRGALGNFDAARLRCTLDMIAKGTMCVAAAETAILKQAADDLSRTADRQSHLTFSRHNDAPDPVLSDGLSNTFPQDPNFVAYEQAVSAFPGLDLDFEDFFRSIGMHPPPMSTDTTGL